MLDVAIITLIVSLGKIGDFDTGVPLDFFYLIAKIKTEHPLRFTVMLDAFGESMIAEKAPDGTITYRKFGKDSEPIGEPEEF